MSKNCFYSFPCWCACCAALSPFSISFFNIFSEYSCDVSEPVRLLRAIKIVQNFIATITNDCYCSFLISFPIFIHVIMLFSTSKFELSHDFLFYIKLSRWQHIYWLLLYAHEFSVIYSKVNFIKRNSRCTTIYISY